MSAGGNATYVLPNPNTPMAYLPPEAAKALTFQVYVTVGSFAVLLWDVLLHLPQDYKMLMQRRMNITLVVYFISRISSVAFLLGQTIYATVPIGNCLRTLQGLYSIYPLTVPSSVLLLQFRVCAIYNNNKFVVAFCIISWLGLFASGLTMVIGLEAMAIGNTNYCIMLPWKHYTQKLLWIPFVLETLLFLATSWAFMRRSYMDINVKNGIKVMIFGKHLPAFSMSILRDGQAYYLGCQIFALTYLVLYYTHSSPILVALAGTPTFVLVNNMSCYIYRNIRLGSYRGDLSLQGPLSSSNLSSGEQRCPGRTFKLTNMKTKFKDDWNGDHSEGKSSRIESSDATDLEGGLQPVLVGQRSPVAVVNSHTIVT